MKLKIAAAIFSLAMIAVFQSSLRAQQKDSTLSAWEGVYTKEQAKRGQPLYEQHCSSCHESDLSGKDEATPLSGPAFLGNWDGLTIGDLSERVRISMPPNNTGKLSRQQITDILSYVLSVNTFPADNTELSAKLEQLKQIRIDAAKPKTK